MIEERLSIIENNLKEVKQGQLVLAGKLDKLMAYVIPKKEDFSENHEKGTPLLTKEQPENSYRERCTLPRKLPNMKPIDLKCGKCQCKVPAVYAHKRCFQLGLCQECYDKPQSEHKFLKEDYKLIEQPKKKAGTTILAVEKVTDEMVNKEVLGNENN